MSEFVLALFLTSGPAGGDREFGSTVLFLCIRLERWTKGDAASGPGSGALALLSTPENNAQETDLTLNFSEMSALRSHV